MSWCECPFVGMQWRECPLGNMSWCECPFVGMQWRECPFRYAMTWMPPCGCAIRWMPAWVCNDMNVHLENMSWRECPLVGMQWCECSFGYVMIWMFWCKHNLFKNSLYFQNEASTTPETKIFSKLDLLFMKSHLPFDLRLPKILVITVRKSPNGASTWDMMIWLKRSIFTIWLSKRGGTFSRPFSRKMNSLKIKHLKKIHFLVPEYDNLTGVKTHCDRLGNSVEGTLEKRV